MSTWINLVPICLTRIPIYQEWTILKNVDLTVPYRANTTAVLSITTLSVKSVSCHPTTVYHFQKAFTMIGTSSSANVEDVTLVRWILLASRVSLQNHKSKIRYQSHTVLLRFDDFCWFLKVFSMFLSFLCFFRHMIFKLLPSAKLRELPFFSLLFSCVLLAFCLLLRCPFFVLFFNYL